MDHKMLVAFDFDHTICDDNTDGVVQKLLKDGTVPENVKNLWKSNGWLAYMDRIFELLYDNCIDANQIEDIIVSIPGVVGMEEFLTFLYTNGHEIIIISDSNSVFIDYWLKSRQLKTMVSHVFTNPARYDEKGRLMVAPYHTQHECQMSAINLCKGQILMDYIQDRHKQGKSYEKVIYVGDGRNDLCPILRLSETDMACARKNYPLVDRLNKLSSSMSPKAKIVLWKDGTDLQCSLEQIIKFC